MTYPKKMPAWLIREFIEKGYWAGKTVYDFLVETEKKYSNEVAIRYQTESYTFSDFKRIPTHLASSLAQLGIEKGDVVSVQLPNCPQFMFLQVALSMLGAIMNPLHLVFRKRDTYSILNFCETRTFIFPASFGNRDFVDDYSDLNERVPSVEKVILLGIPANGKLPAGYVPFDELTQNNRGCETFAPRTVADDLFYLNFTSGTEGDPKGFLHTFNTFLTNAHRDPIWSSGKETLLTMSPLTHSMGHLATYYCAIEGTKIVLLDKFEPGEAIKLLKSEEVTVIQGTPAHIYGILDHESFHGANIKSVRTVMTGGALVPEELLLRVRRSLGAQVVTGYGMGETIVHTSTVRTDPDWAQLQTVGRVCAGNEIKIFDPVVVDDKAIGEIGYRGPGLFIEYFKNPARTDETRDDEGWFHTGDLGWVDDQGYLRITGRKKDVINRGGTKIFPGEIESLLKFHPKIRDISIIAMPDKIMGERSCACVILHPGMASIALEELESFLKDQGVTPYKWPEQLVTIDEFTMTPTGKVQKDELRKKVQALIAAGQKT